MSEELDYEFGEIDQENTPPAAEGIVIISDGEDNDDDVLQLDASGSLEQQPEWAEAVDKEKRALRLLNLKARLGPRVQNQPPAAAAAAAPAVPMPVVPLPVAAALAASGRTAKMTPAKPLTAAQRKEAKERMRRLRRL